MRLVIDSNVLQEESLREFLSASRKNKAIVTDYLMIEALKGDPLGKIFKLMKIICEYPKQIIVLKSLRSIGALKGRRSGMTRRMIEKDQSKNVGNWCDGLAKAERGDSGYRRELIARGREADEEMNAVISAQGRYAEVIANEAQNYTQEELRILRTDQPYTPQMIDKMAERVLSLAIGLFESHPGNVRPPTVWELPYSYLFRLAVCAYLQALVRIRDGGAGSATADKIANDIVDATFAAEATYFQGLLTNDAKTSALYRNAKHVLKGFPVTLDKLQAISRSDPESGMKTSTA